MRKHTLSCIFLSLCAVFLHIVSTECRAQELVYLKHITQRGETIETMAKMYDVKADMLKTINYGIDTFHTGLEVLVPVDKKYLSRRTEEDDEAILKDLAGYFSGFSEATRVFDSGDYKKASKLYASTIHAHGKYFPCEEAYFSIAMCDYNRKRWSSAIDGFSHVIGIECCSDELRDYSRRLIEEAGKRLEARRERTANFFGGLLQAAAEVGTAYMAASQQDAIDGVSAMPQGESLVSMNPAQIANITVMQTQQQWAQEEMQFKNSFIANYRRIHGCDPSSMDVQAAYNNYIQNKINAYSTVQNASSGMNDNELGVSSGNGMSSSRTTSTNTYGGYKCKKHSATDKAHCNDTGICQACNGSKVTQDMYGNTIDCTVCYRTGKCPSCRGH